MVSKNKWHKMPIRLTDEQMHKADYLASIWDITRTEAIRQCLETMFAQETYRSIKYAESKKSHDIE